MSDVSLSSLLIPSKVSTFDFPGYDGVTIDLCFLSRTELLKIRKKCVTSKFNKKTHTHEDTLDEDKFLSEYCNATIKGWKGFKYSYLEELLLVDVSSIENPEVHEMPFTSDNALTLMKNSTVFEEWVARMIEDLENFTQSK